MAVGSFSTSADPLIATYSARVRARKQRVSCSAGWHCTSCRSTQQQHTGPAARTARAAGPASRTAAAERGPPPGASFAETSRVLGLSAAHGAEAEAVPDIWQRKCWDASNGHAGAADPRQCRVALAGLCPGLAHCAAQTARFQLQPPGAGPPGSRPADAGPVQDIASLTAGALWTLWLLRVADRVTPGSRDVFVDGSSASSGLW